MSKYCDEDYCAREYGFEQCDDKSIWCRTCGRLEATSEDIENGELTEEEIVELLRP